MNQFYLFLSLSLLTTTVYSQKFSINDLVGLTAYPTNEFDNYVSKKGYRPQEQNLNDHSLTYAYFSKKIKEEHQPEWYIAKNENGKAAIVSFQTTSASEFAKLNQQLKEKGFIYTDNDPKKPKDISLYQKANITVQPITRQEEGKTVYGFVVENKILPKAKDIVYAEDLLKLPSHEYLVSSYGAANVKKDVFYFSENETNRCSVLFSNTSQQVIFIWNDEVNYRGISFLLIGGHLQAQSSKTYYKQIELNAWQSNQGIRSGMSLRELEALNGAPLQFYGWESDQPGVLINKTNGNLNLKNITMTLDCFDCNEDRYYTANKIIKSTDVLKDNRRVYVSTIIVLPGDN